LGFGKFATRRANCGSILPATGPFIKAGVQPSRSRLGSGGGVPWLMLEGLEVDWAGEGASARSPWTCSVTWGWPWGLIFGLFACTVFTLFVIPVAYFLLYGRKPGHGVVQWPDES